MAKGKEKREYKADGKIFASSEEIDFYYWLLEAQEAGIIRSFSYQPRTFELAADVTYTETVTLKTKTKEVTRKLLNGAEYTPDFLFLVEARFLPLLKPALHIPETLAVWIDVKGAWSQFNDDVKFSLLRKWTYDKYLVYVNKVIPVDFFEKTFVPDRAAYGKSGKALTRYLNCPRLHEIQKRVQPELGI